MNQRRIIARSKGRHSWTAGGRPLYWLLVAVPSFALLLLTLPVTAAPMEQERLDRLMDGLTDVQPPELGYAMALSLDDFEELLDTRQYADGLKAALDKGLSPRVDALLRWQLAELELRTGETEQAEKEIDGLGFLTRWHVLGPFPNEGMSGYDQVLGPELGFDMNRRVDGKFERMSWRYVESKGRSGYLHLSSFIVPSHDAVSYMTTVVESPVAQEGVLWLTVDGGYKAWVSGKLVAAEPEDVGGPIDRTGYRVKLGQGQNLIVVKVANESGHSGAYVRLTDANLAPLPLSHGKVDPRLTEPLNNDEAALASIRKVPGAIEQAETKLEEAGRDETDWPESAAWLAYGQYRSNPGDAGRPGESLMLEAIEAGTPTPTVALLANQVLEQSWRKRELVRETLAAYPDDAWLMVARAEQLLSGSVYDRADELDELLETLAEREPRSVLVGALQIQRMASEQLDDAAYAASVKLAEDNWQTPLAVDEMQWRAGTLQRFDQQTRALEQLVSMRADIDNYRIELANLYLRMGRLDDAITVIDEGLALHPEARPLTLEKIEILDAQGQQKAARGLWEDLLARVPTSAALREAYGNWLLGHGERSAALQAFRASLELEAQNETLRQMVRYLDPASTSFEKPWVVEEVEPWSGTTTKDYVVLLDQKIVQVHPNGLSSSWFQQVYQAVTDQGVSQLKVVPLYYTPGEEVFEIEMARIIKPDGSIRQVYERDEYSVADESIRMYYDYRQVVLEFGELDVGDRLELRYRRSQVSQSNYFDNHFGDVWYVQDFVPKRLTRYVVSVPEDRSLQLRTPESGVESRVEREDGRTTHVFEAKNTSALENERMMPGFAEVSNYVMVSTFDGWGEVAQWYWNLAKEQWIVDKEIRDVVQDLTEGLEDRREIVSRIHNYVVKNTRYVALEFGVHGYKPYRTTVCFRRRFGDCKDKASLIKVMLEEAGIDSDIVLVRTRRNGDIATDPASLTIFDHAIAYVPEFDLFLDGTAEFSGTRELPAMDQGVTVLVVKDQGEHELVKTPVSSASDNVIRNEYQMSWKDGEVQLSGTGTISGQFAPGYRQNYESAEKRQVQFETELSREYPGAAVEAVDFANVEDLEKPVMFTFEAVVDDLLKKSGDQMLLYPHGNSVNLADRLASFSQRTQDLVLPFAFRFDNSFSYSLPPGLSPVAIPEPTTIENRFGSMRLTVTEESGELKVTSTFELTVRQVDAEDYEEFQEFVLAADRAVNEPVRLSR